MKKIVLLLGLLSVHSHSFALFSSLRSSLTIMYSHIYQSLNRMRHSTDKSSRQKVSTKRMPLRSLDEIKENELLTRMQLLAQSPEKINDPIDPLHAPPIMEVTRQDDLSLLEALLEHNANPNVTARSMFEETALHRVCDDIWGPNIEGATLLLQHGANPDAQTSGLKITPLMEAAKNGFCDLISLLLTNEHTVANPNLQDAQGKTALMYALETLMQTTSTKQKQSLHQSLLTLLAYDADPYLQDVHGNCAISLLKNYKSRIAKSFYAQLQEIMPELQE